MKYPAKGTTVEPAQESTVLLGDGSDSWQNCCTGARSLLFGSCLGVATVVLAVAVTARTLDVSTADELRLSAERNGPKAAEAFRQKISPLGDWLKVSSMD